MDKPSINPHTLPRAARQGATAGASFVQTDMMQLACYATLYRMGPARLAKLLTRPAVKINTKAARRIARAACKRYAVDFESLRHHYTIAGTVTGRLTGRQNIRTLTRKQKRAQ